jgi:hypothetical protein
LFGQKRGSYAEAKGRTNPATEVFSVPLLDRGLWLEVGEVVEIQTFVFGIQLRCTLLTPRNDAVNVVVCNRHIAKHSLVYVDSVVLGCALLGWVNNLLRAMENHLLQLFFAGSLWLSGTTLLNDKLIQAQLLCSALEHTLLDRFLADESEHINLLCLPDAVSAIHSLQIGLGIPYKMSGLRSHGRIAKG